MKNNLSKYLFVYLTPLVVFFSIWKGGIWSYSAVIFLFGILPFLELFTKGSTKNLTEYEEEMAKEDIRYDLLLYSLVPIQYFLLFYFLVKIDEPSLDIPSKIGLTLAFGMACGILGINAAHELGHRNTKYEQLMSKMLLLTTMYLHFFIEHNRGHHKNVSTDEDPASGKYGEIVYTFFIRSVLGSWLSAWQLEKERLHKHNLNFWSHHNEMLIFQILQLGLLTLIITIFSLTVLLWYLGAAIIGILLLETVNYIEHYGLRRKKQGNRYERTMPIHSWNSNHPIGRAVLLELSRHSDHHYMANRKYPILRHFDESPQMPTGYPGMMIMALIPPLWFFIMHKQIEKYKMTEAGGDLD
jgi:alkane 1-monooxygenase